MKVAVLGDMHFAIKSSSPVLCEIYMENMNKFLDNVFFPKMEKSNITRIIQTGDFYDNRKANANIAVANSIKNFVDRLDNMHMDMIVGNHDMVHLHSLTDNSLDVNLRKYNNITIHSKPKTEYIDGLSIDFIPWICDENVDQILDFISKSKSRVCVCHPEINGFDMTAGQKCETGLDRNIFKQYELVIAGHFHIKSKQDNILYVGTPTQHNYGDVNDRKGFWTLDTETLDLEFIENPYNLFEQIIYSDDLTMLSVPDVKDKYVSIKLPPIYDNIRYKNFVDELMGHEPIDIIASQDRTIEYDGASVSLAEIENKSIELVPFLARHTKTIAPDLDETLLVQLYTDLYNRSIME